jgi:O-antigen/teichoic acid export membrane protein
LLGLGRIRPRLVALITASVASLVAYIALIPHLSWRGAVVGTLGSEMLLIVLAWGMLLVYQRRHDRSLAKAATRS